MDTIDGNGNGDSPKRKAHIQSQTSKKFCLERDKQCIIAVFLPKTLFLDLKNVDTLFYSVEDQFLVDFSLQVKSKLLWHTYNSILYCRSYYDIVIYQCEDVVGNSCCVAHYPEKKFTIEKRLFSQGDIDFIALHSTDMILDIICVNLRVCQIHTF